MSSRGVAERHQGYRRPMPATWWLKKKNYTLFMVRELTAWACGGYALLLLVAVTRAGDQSTFAAFIEALKSPLSVALHLVVLALAAYHSITWFNLTPKVLIVWRGEEKVPPAIIAGGHYAAWLVVSLLILWLAMRAG